MNQCIPKCALENNRTSIITVEYLFVLQYGFSLILNIPARKLTAFYNICGIISDTRFLLSKEYVSHSEFKIRNIELDAEGDVFDNCSTNVYDNRRHEFFQYLECIMV